MTIAAESVRAQCPPWHQVNLDDVAVRGSGHTPDKKRPEYWNGSVPWVSLKDTFKLDQGLISTTTETITRQGLANSSAVVHPAGSVVLLRDAGIGKSAILGTDMAVSQHFIAWTCGPRLDNLYLYYHLQSMKPEFERISNGSTIKTIGLGYFRQLKIPLPAIEEQRLIAQAVRDADDLIATLERMIAKKQAIKQGMMQQLLTGKTRLPGFQAEWTTAPLKEFLPLQRGFDLPTSQVRPGPYPVVYSNGVLRRHAKSMVNGPGVVTGRSGTIGKVHYVEQDYWPHNTSLWVTNFTRVEALFAYYFLSYLGLERFASGSGVPTFNRNDAHSFLVNLPIDRGEQAAIADVLRDADTELSALTKRLTKAREVKQGMMQQLLTARIRLPAKEAAA